MPAHRRPVTARFFVYTFALRALRRAARAPGIGREVGPGTANRSGASLTDPDPTDNPSSDSPSNESPSYDPPAASGIDPAGSNASSSGTSGGGGEAGEPPHSSFWRTRQGLISIVLASFLVAAGGGSLFGYFLTFDIPEVRHLQDWNPPVVTTLYAADGSILFRFGSQKRILIGLDQIPQAFIDALVSTEDAGFFRHVGIDPRGIARAIIMDILRARKAQGGSTITQQLARSLFLKPEKTIRRKLQEIVLALQVEKSFTKNEILTFYCNQVYMGHGRYGIESASQHYFNKPVREADLPEAALLAGLIQRPEAYSPIRSPDRALSRRSHVLNRMVKEKRISAETADRVRELPIEVAQRQTEENLAPYFVEEVRRYLNAKYGDVALYEEGLEVHTTLNPAMQAGVVGLLAALIWREFRARKAVPQW